MFSLMAETTTTASVDNPAEVGGSANVSEQGMERAAPAAPPAAVGRVSCERAVCSCALTEGDTCQCESDEIKCGFVDNTTLHCVRERMICDGTVQCEPDKSNKLYPSKVCQDVVNGSLVLKYVHVLDKGECENVTTCVNVTAAVIVTTAAKPAKNNKNLIAKAQGGA